MRFFKQEIPKIFRLFRNKVDDLVWYIDFFDEVLAFQEGSNSLICFGNLKSFFFLTAITEELRFLLLYRLPVHRSQWSWQQFCPHHIRPFGNCQADPHLPDEFPDFFAEMWSKRAKSLIKIARSSLPRRPSAVISLSRVIRLAIAVLNFRFSISEETFLMVRWSFISSSSETGSSERISVSPATRSRNFLHPLQSCRSTE